jgi:drug/metabolite transporter (DMT)-like permease
MTTGRTDGSVSRLTGVLTIVLTLLGWSSIPLFLRSFTHDIDFWTANGWRYGFSAILWAPVIVVGIAKKSLPAGLWRAALVPALFNAAGQGAFAAAPYHVEPGLMTFALRVQIVFVAIAAAVLFPAERRIIKSRGFLAGLGLVVLGTVGTIILSPKGMGGGTGLGVSLALTSGLLFACYALAVRHYMHGVNPLVAFAAISQYTALFLVVPMLVFGQRAGLGALDLPARRFALVLLSSLIGIGLGHTFYYFSIARLGLAVSAGVVQLQPFLVAAASFVLFGERLTALQWASGAVAICGAAAMLYTQHRLAQPPTSTAPRDIDAFKTLPIDADTAAVEAEADQ